MSIPIHEFKHETFGTVRTTMWKDQIYFSITDICKCFGIQSNVWCYNNLLESSDRLAAVCESTSYDNITDKKVYFASQSGIVDVMLSINNITNISWRRLLQWLVLTVVPSILNKNTSTEERVNAIITDNELLKAVMNKIVDDRVTNINNIKKDTPASTTTDTSEFSGNDNHTCNSTPPTKLEKYPGLYQRVNNDSAKTTHEIDWVESIFKTDNNQLYRILGHSLTCFCANNNYKIYYKRDKRGVEQNAYTPECIEAFKKYLLSNKSVLFEYRRPVTTPSPIAAAAAA